MSSYFTSGSDGIGKSSDLHGAKVQIYFELSKCFEAKATFYLSVWVRYPFGEERTDIPDGTE